MSIALEAGVRRPQIKVPEGHTIGHFVGDVPKFYPTQQLVDVRKGVIVKTNKANVWWYPK